MTLENLTKKERTTVIVRRAYGQFKKEDYVCAELYFKNAISRNPDNMDARRRLFECYIFQGKYDEALNSLKHICMNRYRQLYGSRGDFETVRQDINLDHLLMREIGIHLNNEHILDDDITAYLHSKQAERRKKSETEFLRELSELDPQRSVKLKKVDKY